MDKTYIKSQIAIRQAEFPTDLYPREHPLPVNCGKIVTIPGVRRCGKSSRMENVINELLAQGVERERFLWVSFDDERLVKMSAEELHTIIEAYQEMYPALKMSDIYIFFDEIQLIEGWEYFVMKLYKHYTKNIYISGSNATMLSTELKSALRGWPLEEATLPLSFREYCTFKDIAVDSWLESDLAQVRNAFHSFNTEGGFPEVTLTTNPLLKTRILQTYFDTMLLKDLAEHYSISNIEVLRYFLKRIMENVSKPTSINAIHGDIKSRGLKISKDSLYEWINHACSIFMFFRVPKYSRSLQKTESSQAKYYSVDNGLRDSILLPQSDDYGKKLENTVYLQLRRLGSYAHQIFYYQNKGECDFVVQRGVEIEALIQVTWSLKDPDTRKREIDGLLEAQRELGAKELLIITAEEEETISIPGSSTIQVVPAWKWLLNCN